MGQNAQKLQAGRITSSCFRILGYALDSENEETLGATHTGVMGKMHRSYRQDASQLPAFAF
eukprot:1158526-Pelagomonas_calceolata.AAC.3